MTEKIDGKIEQMFWREIGQNIVEELQIKLAKVNEKLEYLIEQTKRLPITRDSKFGQTSNPRDTIKLYPYYEKSSWQMYKTWFSFVAEANVWDRTVKACHLAVFLKSDPSHLLVIRLTSWLWRLIEFHFGEKCAREISCQKLKLSYQKKSETL